MKTISLAAVVAIAQAIEALGVVGVDI